MNFGKKLRYLRTKAGKSRYRLWKITGLDQTFLSRLEKGEKNPSRNTVILLGLALVHDCNEITCHDIDELLLMADYAPLRSEPKPGGTGTKEIIRRFNMADKEKEEEQAKVFVELECIMPDLFAKMRKNITESPMSREFVLDVPQLAEKLRILEKHGLIYDITSAEVPRYIMTEKFTKYLGGGTGTKEIRGSKGGA